MISFCSQDGDDTTPRTPSNLRHFRMVGALAFAFVVFFLPSAVEATASYFPEDDPEWLSLRESSPGTTNLALLPASPDCWIDAIQALQVHTGSVLEEAFHATSTDGQSHPLSSVTCSWLTAVDQKVLALELSKCHMRDLERPLFHFSSYEDQEACAKSLKDYSKAQEEANNCNYSPCNQTLKSRNISTKCLAHLTDSGVNSYTHFFSYVNQLCTRLLSEYVLGQYYETSFQLARSSKIAEEKIQSLIEQQDLLFHRWTEREEHVLGMYDQLESHVEKQTISLESKIGRLRMKLDEEHRHWEEEYARFQESLVKELGRYQREFAFFSGIGHKVQDFIAYWTNIVEWLWKSAQIGQSVFRGVYLTIGVSFSCLILTWPSPLRWMRATMMVFLVAELMVEIGALAMILYDRELDTFWQDAYLEQCESVRPYLFHGVYGYFLSGLVRSAFCGLKKHRESRGVEQKREKKQDHAINRQCTDRASESAESNIERPFAQQLDRNWSLQQNMGQRAHNLYRQPVGMSAFQPPVLHLETARASSNDESAAGTEMTQESQDQRTAALYSKMVGVSAVGLHPQVFYATFPMAHSATNTFGSLTAGAVPQHRSTAFIGTNVGASGQVSPGNDQTRTPTVKNPEMYRSNTVRKTTDCGNKTFKGSEANPAKRLYSNLLVEGENEEDRAIKRSKGKEKEFEEEEGERCFMDTGEAKMLNNSEGLEDHIGQ
ncbi:hypothetical protein IV203_005991 [Nitzschia inconspicua]|uniref:Transmembrane protein n=1 Tax=Nitzschia inconspicua TaxID=303405 RepID=A0A9K3KN91_9STRA|nr:hypothetical protein IV203_005991 [Nitzschia inconspicua]